MISSKVHHRYLACPIQNLRGLTYQIKIQDIHCKNEIVVLTAWW